MSKSKLLILSTVILLYSAETPAQLAFHDPVTNQGVLDQVVSQFSIRAAAWQSVIMSAASWLFWTLGTISFTWTMGMLALKKADIGDFFVEFIRFTIFFGFFYWLLKNGPSIADAIIRSLRKIGDDAAGTTGLSPSGIVDVGFMIWKQAIRNLSVWSPVDSFVGATLSFGILLLLAAVAVNMLRHLICSWILMYAGIFFLGFGGSRWTSDMAINYFKTVLGIGIQLFAMILLVGIGNDLLTSFYSKMTLSTLNFEELGVMLVFCGALLWLVVKVPPVLASIITGGGLSEIGNVSPGAVAGAAIAGASIVAATAATAGAAFAAGAANIGGGAQALKAAFENANASENSGSNSPDMMAASMMGGSGSLSSGRGDQIALAAAMGDDSGSSMFSADQNHAGRGSGKSESNRSTTKDNSKEDGNTSSANLGTSGTQKNKSNSDGGRHDSLATGNSGEVGSAISKVGRLAAGTAVHLAQGSWDVAKAKGREIQNAAMDRISETTGGKIATAIRARGTVAREQASIAGNGNVNGNQGNTREPVDFEAEVAAFRDRVVPPSPYDKW